MNPSQAWSLLTARALGHNAEPRGFGSLRPEDIRAMLIGLDAEPMMTGMAYHFFDFKALQYIELALWQVTLETARAQDWASSYKRAVNSALAISALPYTARRLAGLAIYECMDLPICPECNGKGTTTFSLDRHPERALSPFFESLNDHEGRIRCATCQGSGRVKLSDRKRADLAGIGKDSWQRIWSKRYEGTHAMVLGWRDQAHSHLTRKLSENSQAA